MDNIAKKIKKYEKLVLSFLQERASVKAANVKDCENVVISDKNTHNY